MNEKEPGGQLSQHYARNTRAGGLHWIDGLPEDILGVPPALSFGTGPVVWQECTLARCTLDKRIHAPRHFCNLEPEDVGQV
jgi:hypothetical protein